MRRCLTLCAAVALLSPPAEAVPSASELRAIRRALDASRTEVAAALLAPLEGAGQEDANVLGLAAELGFQQADYAGALGRVRRALTLRRADESLKALRDLIEAAQRTTAGFAQTTVAGGRFVVRHPQGRDAVLVPYIGTAMEAAAQALGDDLGERPTGPVVVEVLPDGLALSAVSGLPVADIERTGTVAVSKWGRLMITTPRALARGYPWLDTLVHEYAHLVITRATDDRVPIWLQEGIAKFEERRWRDPPGGRLDPSLAHLLDRASATDRFIPFARMHPSIAHLRSQEEAALAFAEVFTFVRFLHQRVGYRGIRDVLGRVAAGEDAADAVSAVVRVPWATFQRWWRGEIRSRRNAPLRAARVLERRFRSGDQPTDETLDIDADPAKRHTRIGDLLWERGRFRAASVEYEKARSFAPEDPIVVNRLARALLETGRAARVVEVVEDTLSLYPDFPASHVHVGRALTVLGRSREAADAFEEAVRLNPFDPEPHCALAELLEDADRVRIEREACSALR